MKNKWLIAGSLIVILVLLFAAIVYYTWQGVSRARQDGVRWRAFSYDIVSAEADEEQRFPISGPAALDIQNDIGNITVLVGAEDEIVITAHKTAWGINQANAGAALERMKIITSQIEDTVTVRVEPLDTVDVFAFRARPDSAVFTITVPADTNVTVRSNAGDITVSDINDNARLHTNFGEVSVKNTQGSLAVDTTSGRITAQNVQADGQTIDLESEFGSIALEQANASVLVLSSNSGALDLEDIVVTGKINLRSEFGSIHFVSGSADMLSIEANSGSIHLEDLEIVEPLNSRTEFGDITLSNVNAPAYDLESNSGNVRLDRVQGTVKAHSEFGDIEVTDGEQVTLDLRTNSGTVTYSGSLGVGPHSLETEFGNIQLTIPEETDLSVVLETEFGRVKSDLVISLGGEFSERKLAGTINGGGELLTASTNNGNITISILNAKE